MFRERPIARDSVRHNDTMLLELDPLMFAACSKHGFHAQVHFERSSSRLSGAPAPATSLNNLYSTTGVEV